MLLDGSSKECGRLLILDVFFPTEQERREISNDPSMLKKRSPASASFNRAEHSQQKSRRKRIWADRRLVSQLLERATLSSQRLTRSERGANEDEFTDYSILVREKHNRSRLFASPSSTYSSAAGASKVATIATARAAAAASAVKSKVSTFIALSRFTIARRRLSGMTFSDKLERTEGSNIREAMKQFTEQEIATLSAVAPNDSSNKSALERLGAARSCSERIYSWLEGAAEALRAHPLWRHETDEEFASTMQELENRVFNDLFEHLFRCTTDCDHDRALMRRMELLANFVTAEHLDAPALNGPAHPYSRRAVDSLRAMHTCRSPRAKVECAAVVARELCAALGAIAEADSAHGGAAAGAGNGSASFGADDLLPVVIIATLRAMPPWFHSDLKFIEVYCSSHLLTGEVGYLLTQLSSAKMFLERLDASRLTGLDEKAFAAAVAKAEDGGAIWEVIEDVEEDEEDRNDGDASLHALEHLSLQDYRKEWAQLSSPIEVEEESGADETSRNLSESFLASDANIKGKIAALKQIFQDHSSNIIAKVLADEGGDLPRASETLLALDTTRCPTVDSTSTCEDLSSDRSVQVPTEELKGWNQYFDVKGRAYWHHSETDEWFWVDETQEESAMHSNNTDEVSTSDAPSGNPFDGISSSYEDAQLFKSNIPSGNPFDDDIPDLLPQIPPSPTLGQQLLSALDFLPATAPPVPSAAATPTEVRTQIAEGAMSALEDTRSHREHHQDQNHTGSGAMPLK